MISAATGFAFRRYYDAVDKVARKLGALFSEMPGADEMIALRRRYLEHALYERSTSLQNSLKEDHRLESFS
jgi:hypothetical protein